MRMHSNVRPKLCAASLPAWKRLTEHPSRKFTWSRSSGDSIPHNFSSPKRIYRSTRPVFSVPLASLDPPSMIISKAQATTNGSAALNLGLASGSWQASSKRSEGCELRKWDRRKLSVYGIQKCRNFSCSGKTSIYPSKRRLKDPANPRETMIRSHHVPDSKGSGMHASPQASPAGKSVASDSTQKHLIDRLPNIPQIHRPSKEELLAAATGFWSRLKVRFKWFSIRSARPFNADEIGAFFSWVLVGHVLWIVLGTTTFFSLAILAVNTVFAQGGSRFTPLKFQC